MKKATEVFNEWAAIGKDEGMKKNHFPAFEKIKKIIKTKYCDQEKLTIGDFGCGNGWATDNLMNEPNIDLAIGYDGSEEMIYKKFWERFKDIDKITSYAIQSEPEKFFLAKFLRGFEETAGLKRSVDKIYEIVVYSLFETLIEAMNVNIIITVDGTINTI